MTHYPEGVSTAPAELPDYGGHGHELERAYRAAVRGAISGAFQPVLLVVVALTMLFLLSFGLRLWALYSTAVIAARFQREPWHEVPFSPFLAGDSAAYQKNARNLLEEGSLGTPFFPPLTNIAIAGLEGLGGVLGWDPVHATKLGYCLLGSLVPVLTVLVGALFFSWGVGWAAGLLTALSFGQIAASITYCAELPYTVLLLLAVGGVGVSARQPTGRSAAWGWAVACGVVGALAQFSRSEFLPLWLVLLGWLLLSAQGRWRSRLGQVAVMLAVLGLGVGVWTYRNYVYLTSHPLASGYQLSPWVPMTLNGAVNFYIGNNELANGGFTRLPLGNHSGLDIKISGHRRLLSEGYAVGWEWIRSNPAHWAELAVAKLQRFWEVLRLGYGRGNLGGGLEGELHLGDLLRPERGPLVWLHGLLLLAGVVRLYQAGHRAGVLLLLSLLLVQSAVMVAWFGLTRAALPFVPLLGMLMAGAGESPHHPAESQAPATSRLPVLMLGIFGLVVLLDLWSYGQTITVRQLQSHEGHLTSKVELWGE